MKNIDISIGIGSSVSATSGAAASNNQAAALIHLACCLSLSAGESA